MAPLDCRHRRRLHSGRGVASRYCETLESNVMKIGIIGSGSVAQSLAVGFPGTVIKLPSEPAIRRSSGRSLASIRRPASAARPTPRRSRTLRYVDRRVLGNRRHLAGPPEPCSIPASKRVLDRFVGYLSHPNATLHTNVCSTIPLTATAPRATRVGVNCCQATRRLCA
jgi:hypothetical protein